jgi:antitoxin VapB
MQLAQRTGGTLTRTVTIVLKEHVEREKRRRNRTGVAAALRQIARRCASRPLLDDRSPEAILGYDEHGLPR